VYSNSKLTGRKVKIMGKNKQQAANEARAKKAKAPEVSAAVTVEEVKPVTPAVQTAPAAPAPTEPSKQDQTIAKLKEGWTAKGVDLSKLAIKDDGKFKLLIVADGWPTVQIGPTGGITVVELKSYQKAFDAAMDGLALYDKQKAREQKKAAATAPAAPNAATPEAPAPAPAVKEKKSVTARKAEADDKLEQQLQA
jgi:hypothetical protein